MGRPFIALSLNATPSAVGFPAPFMVTVHARRALAERLRRTIDDASTAGLGARFVRAGGHCAGRDGDDAEAG